MFLSQKREEISINTRKQAYFTALCKMKSSVEKLEKMKRELEKQALDLISFKHKNQEKTYNFNKKVKSDQETGKNVKNHGFKLFKKVKNLNNKNSQERLSSSKSSNFLNKNSIISKEKIYNKTSLKTSNSSSSLKNL